MTYLLAALVVLSALADNFTTWACLRAPSLGWHVTEVNPLSAWVFREIGVVQGLALDTALTLVAVTALVRTRLFSRDLKQTALLLVFAVTCFAVANNLQGFHRLGLHLDGSPL